MAGSERQIGISKQGDGYLRRLLVIGATAVLRFARQNNASQVMGSAGCSSASKPKVVAVALANKTARIAWALMARGTTATPSRPRNTATAELNRDSSRDVQGC